MEIFTNFQYAIVPFDENNTISTINVINAYKKTFGFYYQANNVSGLVYFVVFIVDGSKNDLEEFTYEILVQSPVHKYRKVKFVEKCLNAVENVENTIRSENCLVLPKSKVATYLHNNNLHFRLLIKPIKNQNEIENDKNAEESEHQKSVTLGSLTRPNGFIFSNKGTILPNKYKKGTSTNRNLLAPLLIGRPVIRTSTVNTSRKTPGPITRGVTSAVRSRR